jgi:hypothetical protein
VRPQQEAIRIHVETIRKVAATSDPAARPSAQRQSDFDALLADLAGDNDPVHVHMTGLMRCFRAGLFVGGGALADVHDNLGLERWFRLGPAHQQVS